MKHKKIKTFLQEKGADWVLWKTNQPGASHMAGVWECQTHSAQSILQELLKPHRHSLNAEFLVTLMNEVESIINSRPLTEETVNDTKNDIPLSPSNHLT